MAFWNSSHPSLRKRTSPRREPMTAVEFRPASPDQDVSRVLDGHPARLSGRSVRGRAARCRRWWGSGPVNADRGSVRGAGADPRARRHRRRGRIRRYARSSARDRPRPNACRSRTYSPAPAPGICAASLLRPVAGQGSSTGRPAAMSAASSRSVAGVRRTPRGVRLLRNVAWIWVAGRPRWVRARVRSTAVA